MPFVLAVLLTGCASTPEKKAAEEQRRATEKQSQAAAKEQRKITEEKARVERKAAEEQRKTTEEQSKVEKEQKRWQQTLAPYNDEQLRYKLAGLKEAVARGEAAIGILLAQGNGLAVLIGRGEFEAKVKERDAVGNELARREGGASRSVPDGPPPGNDSTSPKASGTGFFITEDGFLITNEHVVKGAARVRCLFKGAGADSIFAKVVKVDAANDLALLKAEGQFAALPVASSRGVKLGGTVATVGFPNPDLQGYAHKLAKGEIASLSGVKGDVRYFQISVAVQPGNSGGALVDERGNVVGVVSAKLNWRKALATSGSLPENVNYAVKSAYLLSFLESEPEVSAKLKEPNTKEMKFEDAVKSAEQAAVLVLVY